MKVPFIVSPSTVPFSMKGEAGPEIKLDSGTVAGKDITFTVRSIHARTGLKLSGIRSTNRNAGRVHLIVPCTSTRLHARLHD